MHRVLLTLWTALVLFAGLCSPARADVSYPAKPGPREFIYDGARLIHPDDAAAIKATADKLLTDKNIPIVVATIESLASFNAGGWQIERYATNLFDEWGIGRADYNYGILLLVSKGDRKARIELGKGFTRERDERCAQIMSETIIPRFKAGDYSGGIRTGVLELDALARGVRTAAPRDAGTSQQGQPLPSAPVVRRGLSPTALGPLVCVGIGILAIVLLIVVAAARRGAGVGYGGAGGYGGGWGGGGWGSAMPPWWWWVPGPGSGRWGGGGGGGIFGSSTRSSSGWGGGGGGFGGGGGSFGGGFSGGGGATGSW